MKKIWLITIVVSLCAGLAFVVKSDSDNNLKCDQNGNFTILVVSDPQCDNIDEWQQARDELETLVKRSSPNLVLINGDMNSYNKIPEDMWQLFISPLTSREIYWSTTNGNHDPFVRSNYNMYKSYNTCLNDVVSTTDINYESKRPMNYVLPIYSNDGDKIVFAIYAMDSGTKTNGIYEGITKKQIAWYRDQASKLQLQNGGKTVTSILCMHIPLPQILEGYYGGECKIFGIANEINYAASGYMCKNGKCIDKINVHTSSVKYDTGMFNAITETGDIKAVLFGHNHRNNFITSYKGILLGFVGKLSTGCYSDDLCRGGRVIRFNEAAPQNFTTEWMTSLDSGYDQPPIYSNGTLAN